MAAPEAELAFTENNLKRKSELLDAGISTRAEVEEARTRFDKAPALTLAAGQELVIARRQIPLFEKNIRQYKRSVDLATQAVTESNFERNKSVYSQSALVGTEIPPELTASCSVIAMPAPRPPKLRTSLCAHPLLEWSPSST